MVLMAMAIGLDIDADCRRRAIRAEGIERAVGDVEDLHHPEDQAQTDGDEKQIGGIDEAIGEDGEGSQHDVSPTAPQIRCFLCPRRRCALSLSDAHPPTTTTPIPKPPRTEVGLARLAQDQRRPGQARGAWGKEYAGRVERKRTGIASSPCCIICKAICANCTSRPLSHP